MINTNIATLKVELYVVWQDDETRMWHPVAKLIKEPVSSDEKKFVYKFHYTNGAKNKNFKAFLRLDELSKTYVSNELFKFFNNRLLPKNRPEFKQMIEWSGLDIRSADELEFLGITGGERKTDNFRVVTVPKLDGEYFTIKFFVSGFKYISDECKDLAKKLTVGSELKLKHELDNQHDSNALIVLHDGENKLGYCPRYLNNDLKNLINSQEYFLTLIKVNETAPHRFKFLCEFKSKIPKDYECFISDEYKKFNLEISHVG
ncbi:MULTISPECIES: HIRAN domain-containing protein [Pseudoalteromonas]|jgi:hypothetical protein|uniref:HIRAN domain-containing protein n=1 Tax=Pseudoalteromonas TaxID=53246 RepID=UPI000425E42A|nr:MULTISPECIES: HIRAN domain-containing protein [unclassified Pseudoalteromonas]MDC9497130.1 HIRAN domain-containing protein [Pseudoalteromonas sp. Angola-20]MDC9515833.1 HIRAN domain-containing protein [Pseudoalteromonas sp. Angola-22]MDC9532480.1 HIRAN domain-containing protein [Pseudoalteromonas sp. Angola-9]TMO27964.1 adenylosuccinate lyase [Pseudoalteromonas sp. S4741]TMP83093.1 adenylosuccinate lyase [Pseudoalteromonas sp. S983]